MRARQRERTAGADGNTAVHHGRRTDRWADRRPDPVVQATDGTWIAWGDGDADFAVTDEQNCVAVPPDEEAYTLQRLELSEEAVESYYYGFSNRVLWPLCHGFPDLIENRTNDFEWYRTVNEQFADAVGEHAEDDSVIWLQDYHLALRTTDDPGIGPRERDRRPLLAHPVADAGNLPALSRR